MKKQFNEPSVEVTSFEFENIMTTTISIQDGHEDGGFTEL